jgi:hypothetical protein
MLSDDRLSRLSVYVVFLIPSSCPGDGWRDGRDEGEMRLLLWFCFLSFFCCAALLLCVGFLSIRGGISNRPIYIICR